MRIGDYLASQGLISAAQLEEGLRAQVRLGARLGTNLVELGFIELDALAAALAHLHGLMPALKRDFHAADVALQKRLPAELAARWAVVPLRHVSDASVAIACTGPLSPIAVRELERALVAPVIPAVAAELRLYYYLERVYDLPRANRFMRVRPTPLNERAPTEQLPAVPLPAPPTDAGQSEDWATDGEPTVPVARERRSFVKTLSDVDIDDDSSGATPLLGRLHLKRISVEQPAQDPLLAAPESLDEILAAIRRATGRDRIGDLVVAALRGLWNERFDAALLLVVRKPVAIGWKGFLRGQDDSLIEHVAVPLTARSVILEPYLQNAAFVGELSVATELDRRLWARLGTTTPRAVAVLPVTVRGETLALLYAQSAAALPMTLRDQLTALANTVAGAFDRLMRSAER